jgi:hypothetical protein
MASNATKASRAHTYIFSVVWAAAAVTEIYGVSIQKTQAVAGIQGKGGHLSLECNRVFRTTCQTLPHPTVIQRHAATWLRTQDLGTRPAIGARSMALSCGFSEAAEL